MMGHRRPGPTVITPAWLTAGRRRGLYSITAAGLVVAGVYGVATGAESAAWLGLAAAVLGVAQDNVQD